MGNIPRPQSDIAEEVAGRIGCVMGGHEAY